MRYAVKVLLVRVWGTSYGVSSDFPANLAQDSGTKAFEAVQGEGLMAFIT